VVVTFLCSFPYVAVQVAASLYALALRKEQNTKEIKETAKMISHIAEWAFVVL